jgi:hypothetical protein
MFPTQLVLAAVALIALFGLIALAFQIVKRARGEVTGDVPDEPEDLLAALEGAYESGEMDSAEFERVKNSLERRGKGPPEPTDRPEAIPPRPAESGAADARPAASEQPSGERPV